MPAGLVHHAPLQFNALASHLRQTASDHDHAAHAGGGALRDNVRHA